MFSVYLRLSYRFIEFYLYCYVSWVAPLGLVCHNINKNAWIILTIEHLIVGRCFILYLYIQLLVARVWLSAVTVPRRKYSRFGACCHKFAPLFFVEYAIFPL